MLRWGWVGVSIVVGCASGDPVAASGSLGGTAVEDDGEAEEGESSDDGGFCENAPLFYGPTDLPRARVGESYRVDVRDYAEAGWSGFEYYASEELGNGMMFDAETVEVFGTPEAPALMTITVHAVWAADDECSNHPDPHEFRLHAVETGGDTDTDTDSDSDSDSGSGSGSGSGSDSGTTG